MGQGRLYRRMRERIPHILGIGLVTGAMDELRKLPIDLDADASMDALMGGAVVLLNSLFVAFFLILAISATERRDAMGKRRVWLMMLVVGLAAYAASAAVVQFTALLGRFGHIRNVDDLRGLFMHILWTSLAVGALSAAYFTGCEREQEAATRVWEATLEHLDSERHMLEAQLNAMKARVEPAFLVETIGKIEALYRRDVAVAEQRLEDLIAYLRAALPQLHDTDSTLGDELALAAAYLRLYADHFHDGLEWVADVDGRMHGLHFPPMALLPLVDDALRRAMSLDAAHLSLVIRLRTDGNSFSLTVTDNCALARLANSSHGFQQRRNPHRQASQTGAGCCSCSPASVRLRWRRRGRRTPPRSVPARIRSSLKTTRSACSNTCRDRGWASAARAATSIPRMSRCN